MAALGAHKLRSLLTLVGIIAGVAAIISVMTGVSVIQSQMEDELSVLSNRTFQLSKEPMGGFNNDRNINFREIARWPPLTMEHVYAIRERVKSVDLVGAELWQYNTRVSYRGESTEANKMLSSVPGVTKIIVPPDASVDDEWLEFASVMNQVYPRLVAMALGVCQAAGEAELFVGAK